MLADPDTAPDLPSRCSLVTQGLRGKRFLLYRILGEHPLFARLPPAVTGTGVHTSRERARSSLIALWASEPFSELAVRISQVSGADRPPLTTPSAYLFVR